MSKYGIPCMGSKSSIAEKICKIFPRADNFYDLFGGGFSITHCMIQNRSSQFKEFHFNEIRSGVCELIQDAINGKYNYDVFKPEFIDREAFLKNNCAYIKLIWSFGNNWRGYLFGKDIESYKKSIHNAVVFNIFDETVKSILGIGCFKDDQSIKKKRLFVRKKVAENNPFKKKEQLEQLEQLQRLERLQRLNGLNAEKIKYYSLDYKDILIKDNSIIYCDPPYKKTETRGYGGKFNTQEFLDWANNQKNPVFISEYEVEDKRFKLVGIVDKKSMLNPDKSKTLIKQEKIYCNQAALRVIYKK